jgi:hypothetical protein
MRLLLSRASHLTARSALAFAVLAAAIAGTGCQDDTSVVSVSGRLESMDLVDFGDVQVGILLPLELEVKNVGTGVLRVTNISVPASFSGADYEFKLAETSFTLQPNQTKQVAVSFKPFAAMTEPVESSFRIETDIVDEVTNTTVNFTVRVRGRGVESGLEVIPNPVDFGNVLVGSSTELEVQVFNRLSVPVDLTTRIGGDGRPELLTQSGLGRFELLEPEADALRNGSLLPVGEQLAPGASITARLRYVPDPGQEGQQDRGRWTISNCLDSLCELDVPLLGRGTNEAIRCVPGSLDFGQVNPGATLTRRTTCSNVATETVTVRDWVLGAGSSAEYKLAPNDGRVANLAPGESFDIEVQFAPTEASIGSNPVGTLVVRGRNPVAGRDLTPAEVRLVGQAGGPDIAVTPAMLTFGRVAIGTRSVKRLLVENTGYNDLTVRAIEPDVGGVGGFTANRQSFAVPPGGSEVVEITFEPTSAGRVTTEVLITSDDTDEGELRVPVVAEGVDLPPCRYTVTPADVNFGIVQVLRSSTQGVRIQNVGTNDCLLNDINVAVGSSSDFTLVNGPETDVTLAPQETKVVLVNYTPSTERAHTGELTFYVSDPGNPNRTIPLRGVGSASSLLITPNELDFGTVGAGCASRDREITIYNTGSVRTRVDRILLPAGVSTEFQIANLPAGVPAPPGASIEPGSSITFTVRYRSADLGQDIGFFHVFEAGRTDPYVIPLFGAAAEDPVNEDSYQQLETPEVDILFVVDNSCSMSEEQTSLAGNFQSFISFAEAQGLDYRLGVVTTDVDSNCTTPPAANRPGGTPQGACGYFADGNQDSGIGDPSWRLITPDEQPSPAEAFTQIATQGINGSGSEAGLQAAFLALSSPLITGWNSGFLRPSAYLALIFISDEEDQSPNAVDYYINFFLAIKGFRNTQLFSASAIVGPEPGSGSGCGFGADPGTRYIETANRTGGVVESICTADWARALENLGLSVFGYKSRFFLSNQPVVGTVEVYIDGMRLPPNNGAQVYWAYDAATNAVNFSPSSIPEPGSQIDIRYRAECL